MEDRLIALKLFLDGLGVDPDISTVNDRKRLQKSVYIGQLSGVDLGYRFGWYIMGPYSPPLTRDYFDLADRLEAAEDRVGNKELKPEIRAKLEQVRSLLERPSNVHDLSTPDWLELVASYDFLRRVSHYDHARAVATLNEQKPHVAPYVDVAVEKLKEAKLLEQ